MTELVRSQLNIFFIMIMGGLTAGLVLDVFRTFSHMRRHGKVRGALMEVAGWICVGFLISDFFYYCDNGKITFEGIASLIGGLLLWKRVFCDILKQIGGNYGEEKNKRKSHRV